LRNEEDYFHAKQNLLINEISSDKVSIYNKEILVDDDDKKYDTIVSVPYDKRLKRNEMDSIKKYDEYKTKNSNSIHLLNLIDHLDDNGVIVTTTTQDLLVKNDALQLRKCLIERNLLDVVIDYDSGFRSKDIIILIINKNKKTDDFLFIKPKHLLPGLILPSDEENMIKSYENREIIPKLSNIIDKEEIIRNEYNLNPKRYVYTLDYEEQPIEKILDQQKKYSDRIMKLDEEIEDMIKHL
ncbi:N-6 DNA methylase, partial [Methanosphaera sp.]